MVALGKNIVFVLSIAFAMLKGINCVHFSASAMIYAIPEIYSLLENVTDTVSAAVRVFETQLAKQHDKTMGLFQNELLDVLQCRLDNNTGLIDVFQSTLNQITNNQQQKQDQVINYLLQGLENLLKTEQDKHQEIATLLQNHQQTLTQIAETQAQMAVSQVQMANAFNQVVSLLQTQNQQLQNVTDTMNTVVSVMENQQATLENISPSVHDTTTLTTAAEPMIQDCSDLATNGYYPSRVYTITPRYGLLFDVYCDMDTTEDGWTVFHKRFNGSVNFYREWDEYEQGFGSLDGEFWLGLDKIHQLTQLGNWTLRVDLEDFEGNTAYAEYESFQVGAAASNYTLSIGSYYGTAGDALRESNGRQFSTHDRDNDAYSGGSCVAIIQGAGWHGICSHPANLNGPYVDSPAYGWKGIIWYQWTSLRSLKRAEMKVKRTQ